jgi:hypothetical protein
MTGAHGMGFIDSKGDKVAGTTGLEPVCSGGQACTVMDNSCDYNVFVDTAVRRRDGFGQS